MPYRRTNWVDSPDNRTPVNANNLNNIEDGIEEAMNITSKIVDLIYPVGSVYMSTANVSPQVFLGGTWNQIKDTFLLASGDTYQAGSASGEATHTLTLDEMPNHNHAFSGSRTSTDNGGVNHTHIGTTDTRGEHSHTYKLARNMAVAPGAYGASDISRSDLLTNSFTTSATGNHAHNLTTGGASAYSHSHTFTPSGTISNTGGGKAMNNMPPYLTVYMWERVA